MRRFQRAVAFAFVLYVSLAGATSRLWAQPSDCEGQFKQGLVRDPQEILSTRLTARFPRLAFVLKNPDQFFATMSERFEKQKVLTPKTPYEFDYSEIGIPLMKDMKEVLDKKIAILAAVPKLKYEEAALHLHLKELRDDAEAYLEKSAISYQGLIEFCSFYTRAIGHLDTVDMTFFQRNFLKLDRSLQGYKPIPIGKIREYYENHQFRLFQANAKSSNGGFKISEQPYLDALSDPNQLRTVIVPTNDALDSDILMRLVSRENINLAGVAETPILADGFLRPSGDFWIHDLRHESAKFFEKMAYIEKHKLTPGQVKKINYAMDRWYVELQNESAKIEDPTVRKAVDLMVFNFSHDRGYPMAPSVYLAKKPSRMTYLLYHAMKAGGEEVPFEKPFTYLPQAEDWVLDFWKKRVTEETQILSDRSAP